MPPSSSPTCLIVGAGLAGLVAARELTTRVVAVTLLDKGRSVGGRLATRRIGDAVLDHGAQFFTVRDPAFGALVDGWLAEDIAREWTRGFADAQGQAAVDGHPRYVGVRGMTGIAKHLAAGLDIRVDVKVTAIRRADNGWTLDSEDGAVYTADALILTPPVPQSLALLDAGGVALPADLRRDLDGIQYEPCLALLARLDRASAVPPPGGVQLDGEPLGWLADNRQKGISPTPAVTVHAAPGFSRAHYRDDDATVAALLLEAARPWLGSEPVEAQVKRWRYARPSVVYLARCAAAPDGPPLVFAGDAFGGPRVEGAALSGIAAAEAILASLAL